MRSRLIPVVLMAAVAVSVTSPSRADVSLTMHTTMHNAMMDQMMASAGPEQQKMMNDMMNSMVYMSGKHYRMDNAMFSMVMDAGAKQMTMISNTKRTYCVVPANKAAMNGIMDRIGVKMPTDGSKYKVVDTGKTTQIHGHKCRHFVVTMTMDVPNAGEMKVRSDILAAQDFVGVDPGVFQTFNAQIGIHGTQVRGVPLETVTTVTGGVTGDMTVKQTATNISTDPIPSDDFEVPAGYQQVSQADFFQMPTMPGMPAQ